MSNFANCRRLILLILLIYDDYYRNWRNDKSSDKQAGKIWNDKTQIQSDNSNSPHYNLLSEYVCHSWFLSRPNRSAKHTGEKCRVLYLPKIKSLTIRRKEKVTNRPGN